jgi:surface antigen
MRVATATVLAMVAAAAGADYSFYQDMPQGKMTREDMAMADATLTRALDEGQEGQTYHWENAATGASGAVRVNSPRFQRDGMTCRRASIQAKAKGLANESAWVLCRTADGWKVAGG